MNMQQLSTFCVVLKEGSMTAAAAKLFLTQPAVSQQIRQLEEELAVELLVRGSRKVKPTPQGALLYDYATRILHLAKQAELAIQSMGAEVSGTFRVGTLNSIGLHLISPVFSIFLKNNNQVSLKLHYGDGSDVLRELEAGDIDMAILPDAKMEFGGEPASVVSHVIGKDEMWLVTSIPDAPTEIHLEQINQLPVIHFSHEYPGFENVLQKEMKKSGQALRPVFESSNVGSLKRIVEAGLGWGFLPSHSIKKQIQTGRLKRVKVTDFNYVVSLMCYMSKGKKLARASDVFLKILQQQSGL